MAAKPASAKTRAATWPAAGDYAMALAVVVFTVLISLFAIRNNDIWWHMASARAMVGSGDFIRSDIFSYTIFGAPWVPHAWLADMVFYAVHALGSTPGLVALRALLVTTTLLLTLRLLRRLGVSWTLAAPVLLVAILNAHSRFIIRPHLFEYVFIMLLLGWLLTRRRMHGARFFVPVMLLQVLWVNMHASFYLGILLVALFYAGEWLSVKMTPSLGTLPFVDVKTVNWRNAALLVVAMAAVSFINPSPIAFVIQPLSSEQSELLTRYTLEWRSPFAPGMANAAFHPYYEILLGFTVVAFALSIKHLRLSSLLLVAAFLILSLKSHRFRVEFALLAVPLALEQLKHAPLVDSVAKRLRKGHGLRVVYLAAVFASAVLIGTARDRVEFGAVSDRFPIDAFRFVRDNDIAQRPFHSIGNGSFLLWDLYPERQSFIDGRNISASLYQDFLSCQTNSQGFNNVVRKYRVDGFVLPVPERSDGGMRNVHSFLVQSPAWSLVHIDRNAYVYVGNSTVPSEWLDRHAYRFYIPQDFIRLRFTQAQVDSIGGELARAVAGDSLYIRPLIDLAKFRGAAGDMNGARSALERALRLDPDNVEARSMYQQLP